MKGKLKHPDRPYGRDDYQLVAAGREGTYWQAADGLVVRLATPDRKTFRQVCRRNCQKVASVVPHLLAVATGVVGAGFPSSIATEGPACGRSRNAMPARILSCILNSILEK